jgi:hypothetical protein
LRWFLPLLPRIEEKKNTLIAYAPKISYNLLKYLAKLGKCYATGRPESPGISKEV